MSRSEEAALGHAFESTYGPTGTSRHLTDSDKVNAREAILHHETFLQTLCDVPSYRSIAGVLAGGTEGDLNILAYVIFLINIHEIGMAKANRDKLISCRKYERLRQLVKHKPDFDYFISLPRKEKLERLQRVGCGLPIALRNLFYEKPRETPTIASDDSLAEQQAEALAQRLATNYPSPPLASSSSSSATGANTSAKRKKKTKKKVALKKDVK